MTPEKIADKTRKNNPMNDSERLKDLLWKERDELQNKLDRMTTVHKFDPNDKSTWPEDGKLVCAIDDTLYKPRFAIFREGVFGYDGQDPCDSGGNDHVCVWFAVPNSLQAHLNKLKNPIQ